MTLMDIICIAYRKGVNIVEGEVYVLLRDGTKVKPDDVFADGENVVLDEE